MNSHDSSYSTSHDAALDQHIETHLQEHLDELKAFVAQPSISAQGVGIEECAQLVKQMLEKRGAQVEIIPYKGSPFVVGKIKGKSDKTLLLYNHYDVQPPEPFELWESEPFKPEERDGKLYGRGIADDKGEISARLAAIDAVLAAHNGELPCSITFLIEGEEEIGSPNIAEFVREHTDLLACDASIWEGGGVDRSEKPGSTLGARGILGVELSVTTMNSDGHSGGAHASPSAAWRMVWALGTLKDQDENVLIDGFYDDVQPPTPADLELLNARPDQSAEYRKQYAITRFAGGRDGTELNHAVWKPTCNIQGITTGYQGKGLKTIVPAQASVKLDFRLVPGQDPDDIFEKLRAHLKKHGFDDIDVKKLGSMLPYKVDPEDPFVQLTHQAMADAYGTDVEVSPIAGGSSPMYAIGLPLDVPIVWAGIGYWDTRLHAPNENIRIKDFVNGTKVLARIIDRFGGVGES